MGQISFVNSLILIGLFTFALGAFAFNFAVDNDAAVTLADDPSYTASSNVEGRIETFYDNANSSSTSFFRSSVESGSETTQTGGEFKVSPSNSLDTTKESLDAGFTAVFGEDSGSFAIFFTALIAVLTTTLFLYIWKTWKGGSPD